MRMLIVDDSELTPETKATPSGNGAPNTSGVFAALSLPEVVMSRLSRISDVRAHREAAGGQNRELPDIAELQLENSPELMATLLNTIGLSYLANGRLEEAECFIEQALEIRLKLFGIEHPQTAFSINSLARVRRDAGQLEEARKKIQQALSIDARVAGADSLASAGDLAVLASIEFLRGELTEAEHAARSSLNIFDEKVAGADPWVPYLLDLVARVHQWRSDFGKASELYARINELDARLYGRNHPVYAARLHNHATVLEANGENEKAKSRYDEAIAILEEKGGPLHPTLIDALGNRGALLITMGDFDGAQRDLKEGENRNRKVRGDDHPFVGYSLLNQAQLAFEQARFPVGLKHLEEALRIFRTKLPANHAYVAAALTLQGRTLVQAQKPADAEAPLEEASRYWLSEFGERSPEHAISRATLARAWYLQGKRPNDVADILKSSLAIVTAVRGEDDRTAQLINEWLEDATQKKGC